MFIIQIEKARARECVLLRAANRWFQFDRCPQVGNRCIRDKVTTRLHHAQALSVCGGGRFHKLDWSEISAHYEYDYFIYYYSLICLNYALVRSPIRMPFMSAAPVPGHVLLCWLKCMHSSPSHH